MTAFKTICDDCDVSWDSKTFSQAIQIKSIHDADNFVHNTYVEDYS